MDVHLTYAALPHPSRGGQVHIYGIEPHRCATAPHARVQLKLLEARRHLGQLHLKYRHTSCRACIEYESSRWPALSSSRARYRHQIHPATEECHATDNLARKRTGKYISPTASQVATPACGPWSPLLYQGWLFQQRPSRQRKQNNLHSGFNLLDSGETVCKKLFHRRFASSQV